MPGATDPERFVILGVHRSGTSLLARLLIAAGCYPGRPHRFRPPDDLNPLGFFEHSVVHGINRRMLADIGAGLMHSAPALDGIPPDTAARFRAPMLRALAELEPRRPWFLKDPQLCLTFPAWRDLIEDPTCLLTLRDPLEVARSLERVGQGMHIEVGLAQWEVYTVAALNATAGCDRVLVDHAGLLADTDAALQRLHVEFGLAFDRSGTPVDQIVQQGLQRARAENGESLPPAVAALYERLSVDGLPPDDETLRVSEHSLEIIDRYGGGGSTSSKTGPRVAIVVNGRLDPVGNRATALVRRTWGAHDLGGVDVFYSFADPASGEATGELRGYLPGGPPLLTDGAVFGLDDVIVSGCGDPEDREARLVEWLLALTHLVDSQHHDAYLIVDPFTHVDVERLVGHAKGLVGHIAVRSANLEMTDGDDGQPVAMLLTRVVAERLTGAAPDVLASIHRSAFGGSSDFSGE